MSIKMSKKLLAVLLTVCVMFAAFCVIPQSTQTIKAESATPEPTHTFLDFGLMDGTYNGNKSLSFLGSDITALINGGVLSETFEFSEDIKGDYYLILFEGAAWNGIYVIFDKNNDRLSIRNSTDTTAAQPSWYINPADVGMTTFKGQSLNLRFAFSCLDTDDLGIAVYVNGTQATTNHYPDCTLLEDGIYRATGYYKKLTDSATYRKIAIYPNEWTAKYTLSSLKSLTFSDFGIADGVRVGWNGSSITNSFKNTVFSANLCFAGAGTGYFEFGNAWSGLVIYNYNDYITFKFGGSADSISTENGKIPSAWISGKDVSIYENNSGSPQDFATSTFKLSISVVKSGNDAKVGIWFNDVLFKNDFIILKNTFSNGGDRIGNKIILEGYTNLTVQSVGINTDRNRKLDIEDFGIIEGKTYDAYNSAATTAPTSLVNTVFTTKLLVGSKGAYIHFNTDSIGGWGGKRFQIFEGGAKASFFGYEKLATSIGLTSFVDNQFTLSISCTMLDRDLDGLKDDVRYSFFINGKSVINIYELNKTGIGRYMSFLPEASSLTFEKVAYDSASYEKLSLSDFSIEPAEYFGAISDTYGFINNSTWTGSKALDNKIFETDIKFNSCNAQLFYGCRTSNGWLSCKINFVDQETLQVVDSQGKVTGLTGKIPAGASMNKTFTLGISTRNVDCDGDGDADDLEFGIWYNGVLLNNKFTYSVGAANSLEPHIGLYMPSSNDIVALGAVNETEGILADHCLDTENYSVEGDTVSVDNVSTGTTCSITAPGVYEVVFTDKNSTFKRIVTAYKTLDTTADGEVDIRDFIRLKKAFDNLDVLTAPGAKAIGVKDGEIPADSLVRMSKHLLVIE